MKPGADDLGPIRAVMSVMGVIAVLVIAGGLAEFLHFEPPGERSGLHARIVGVYAFQPPDGVASDARNSYAEDEPFAAVVDWGSLPAGTVVGAHWYVGDFGYAAGGRGPAPAGRMSEAARAVTTERDPDGTVPADTYAFVVERYAGGRPVEVLARTSVTVRPEKKRK